MSPEQLRGGTVDEGTDLWSLGVLFYEMLEGKRPFDGGTPQDVQASILLTEPPPLSIAGKIPVIGKIIDKCLAKNASDRYETIGEMAEDLHAAQREVYDFLAKKDREKANKTRLRFARFSNFSFANLVLLLILLSGGLYKILGPAATKQFGVAQSTRINNTGKAVRAALSPDGKLLAYAVEEAGRQALFLRRQEADKNPETKNLLAPSDEKFGGITFLPDGGQIYFTVNQPDKMVADLYRIPTAGGERQLVAASVKNAPGFSPDGKRIAFLRTSLDNSREDIWLADAAGGGERLLYTRRMPDYIPHQTQPAWSPDGKVIVFAAGSYNRTREEVIPLAVRVEDGRATPVFDTPWEEIWQMNWVADGGGFVMSGRENKSYDNKQLWYVSYPDGKITRLTNDFNDYFGVSVSGGANASPIQVVSIILNRVAPLWSADLSNPDNHAAQITEAGNDSLGVSWAGDKIVYGSMAGGNLDVWQTDADGKNRRQMTFDPRLEVNPIVTPDKRYIVYGSEKSGIKSIWRMNLDGSEQIPLAQNSTEESFAVSADSQTVYYYSYFNGAGALWRVPVTGGEAEKIADGEFESPSVSPDNKFIATSFLDAETKENNIAVWEIKNSPAARRVLKPEAGAQLPGAMRWTPDGKAIVYIVGKKGVGNLWLHPLDGGASRQITNFTSSRIFSFDWSPDGRRVVCARGEITGYATLLSIDSTRK